MGMTEIGKILWSLQACQMKHLRSQEEIGNSAIVMKLKLC